jgi:hypothetical protein
MPADLQNRICSLYGDEAKHVLGFRGSPVNLLIQAKEAWQKVRYMECESATGAIAFPIYHSIKLSSTISSTHFSLLSTYTISLFISLPGLDGSGCRRWFSGAVSDWCSFRWLRSRGGLVTGCGELDTVIRVAAVTKR